MISARSVLFIAFVLIGYFCFLNSELKVRALNSLGKLIEVEGTVHPETPQKTELASKSPVPAQAVASAIIAVASDDRAALKLPAQEEVLERISPPVEQLQKYATNSYLKQDQGTFQILRLRAISKYSYNTQMGNLVDEKMSMAFFDPSEGSSSALPMTFPVVMKKSNGQLGVISGTLLVTMKHIEQAGLLAQRFGLALKAQDNTLDLAYLAAPRADQVSELIQELRQDPSVKSVEAEIVQNWKKR